MNLFTHRDVNHIFIGFWYFNAVLMGSAYYCQRDYVKSEQRTNIRQLFNKNMNFRCNCNKNLSDQVFFMMKDCLFGFISVY